ncbi:MAG: hypothetical protein HYY84_11680 [Deltaproteobacteria bacterium]|nr:hypothetical protein [Deltaproteobacteria bacterium]
MAAGLAILLVFLGGAAVLAIENLERIVEDRESIVRKQFERALLSERLETAEESMVATSRAYLITRNGEYLERLAGAERDFSRSLGDLRARWSTPLARASLTRVSDLAKAYNAAQRQLVAEIPTNADFAEVGRRFEQEVVPKRRKLDDAIEAFSQIGDAELKTALDLSKATASKAALTSLAALLVAFIACCVLAWVLFRHLTTVYQRESAAVQAARRALLARDEILAVVAHDLRSPLNAIMLAGSLLQNGDDAGKKHGDRIVRVAARMADIIKSLLDAASIDAGRFSVTTEPVDVREIVREVTDAIDPLASSKSVHFEASVEAADIRVSADRGRIVQVLMNLVGNAVKFSFEGGAVRLSTKADGDFICFAVADTGPGLAPDHLPHVFDRFWKADAGMERGTGLGLYIAKGIVEAHGGTIQVESRFGEGAKFSFTLRRD